MKKIFLIIIFIFGLFVTGCKLIPGKTTKDLGLNSINDADELIGLLKKTNSIIPSNGIRGDVVTDAAYETYAGNESEKSITYMSTDYTKTNIQVEGVDEGDVMKTDGSRIYTITWDRLQVVQLLGDGQMELLLNERIASDVTGNNYHSYTYYSELYVTDEYLIVIGQKITYNFVKYNNADDGETKDDIIIPFFFIYSAVSVVDIYNISDLEKIDNYEVSGYLLGSRLIDNQLYLISNHYAYLYDDVDFDIRPWYKHSDETYYFDYIDIKYIPDSLYQSFTVISSFNLEKDNITMNNNVFLSANNWRQIYVSKSAIYFASDYTLRNFLGFYEQEGLLVSFQFDKTTGKVFFGGYGIYKGFVLNQFALDEYNGFMRLATTEGWGESVKNRLYIFKRTLVNDAYKLEVVSLLDSGLGKPGERIKSVRFNEDIATIVTFLQTDPFYTIDLSNPYNPKIAGELEIPGFSTYQHPWTDDLIIGIGFDAVDGRVTGMKLALYDISDINNPKEVGKPLVLENGKSGWTFSEATYNHKAIMIDKSRNCIGFAIDKYGDRYGNYYLVFDIDETREQPIQIKHTISHFEYKTNYPNLYALSWYYDFLIKRAFRVDDYLYVVSGEIITSHYLLGDLTPIDEIIFQEAYAN